MKKRLISLMMAAVMAGSLAGCGGGAGADTTAPGTASGAESGTTEGTQTGTQAQDASGQSTIKWAMWDKDLTAYYKPLIEAFESGNPDIKVEMVDLGSSDYNTVLTTQLTGSGSGFDVVSIKDTPGYTTLVNKGILEPLDSYIEKAGVEYPTNDMTFEQYDELAGRIANTEPGQEVYGSHYHTWRSTVQMFAMLDGKHTILDGKYDFLKPYYETILKEQEDGICQDYATLKTSNLHYSGAFSQGNIGMMNMGTWFISTLIEKVGSGEYADCANWAIVKYPHAEGVEPGSTAAQITSLAIPASAPNKDAAWKFMQFVCGEEGAKVLASTGNFPAIMTDDIASDVASTSGFPTDDASREALQTANLYLEMPVNAKSSEVEIVLNEAHDNIMTGNMTVDEGIADMEQKVAAVLGQ